MVVLPYDLARSLIDPMQGHSSFDLKDNADNETILRLNKSLNRKEGEDKDKGTEKRKLPVIDPLLTPTNTTASSKSSSSSTLKAVSTPRRPRGEVRQQQLRKKLLNTQAFNSKSGYVYNMQGDIVRGSQIDKILGFAFSADSSSRAPAGSKEIAQRVKLLGVAGLPNASFQKLVDENTGSERRSTRRWTKF